MDGQGGAERDLIEAALDSAIDLGEWEQPAPTVASGPVRSKQEESVPFKLLDELDKSTTATCKKTPGPAREEEDSLRRTAIHKGTVQKLYECASSPANLQKPCLVMRGDSDWRSRILCGRTDNAGGRY